MNMNDNINNNEDNAGNNGNKGKFSDRLKKIRRDRLKKRKNITGDEEENLIVRGGRNVLKVILALPSVIYTNVKNNKNVNTTGNKTKNNAYFEYENGHAKSNDEIVSSEKEKTRRYKINRIKDMDVSLLRKQREIYIKEKAKIDNAIEHEKKLNELKIINLQKEIISLIKKKLVKNINELEVLQSELFLLKQLGEGDIYLKDCQEDIKEIKKLLSKVKSLKEKYDYLRDNFNFEYMLEYDDDLLIDKILELKSLCSMDDIKYTIDNYKILDEYKFLYLKIDKLQEDTIKYEEYKNNKADELKQRDIDFEKLKIDVYDVDRQNNKYESFVIEQELFLKGLEGKISRISSHEEVSYRLKGFNQLLSNSFKYLGLLLVNPLRGLIPGIATQTLVTRNLVRNLYRNLEWEEDRKMVYEAIDYSNSIHKAINDLDFTASMIDSTLLDINRLKDKYKRNFNKYESSFSGYKDTMRKINKIENAILGSKIKVEKMQLVMLERERQNKNKMKMVKKLNTSSNS